MSSLPLHVLVLLSFLLILRPPLPTLFPYTTLFRSAPLRLPLVPRNGCGRPGRAPERFLPLDITSLLLHVIFDARFRSEEGSAGMPRPISYAVFCLKKKITRCTHNKQATSSPPANPRDTIEHPVANR